jgi:hypothetical protein
MKFIIQLLLGMIIFSTLAIAQDFSADFKSIQDAALTQEQQLQSKSSKITASNQKALMDLIQKRINTVRDTNQKIKVKASDCAKNPDPQIKKECQAAVKNKINEMKAELASIDAEIKKIK